MPELQEHFNDTNLVTGYGLAYTYLGTPTKSFQDFTSLTQHTITSVKLALGDFLTHQPGNITVEIRTVDVNHKPTSTILATVTINGVGLLPDIYEMVVIDGVNLTPGTLTHENAFTEFTFPNDPPLILEAGTEYAIVVSSSDYYGIMWVGRYDNLYFANKGGTTFGGGWLVGNTYLFEVYADVLLEKAIIPSPPNEADGIGINLYSISWLNGGGATKYDIYYSLESLTNSLTLKVSNYPDAGLDGDGVQKRTTYVIPYDPILFDRLEKGVTYKWRIDAKNTTDTVEGDLWTFQTRKITVWDRPDDYDPDKFWKEKTKTWVDSGITTAGGGRHKSYLVVVSDQNEIYIGGI